MNTDLSAFFGFDQGNQNQNNQQIADMLGIKQQRVAPPPTAPEQAEAPAPNQTDQFYGLPPQLAATSPGIKAWLGQFASKLKESSTEAAMRNANKQAVKDLYGLDLDNPMQLEMATQLAHL